MHKAALLLWGCLAPLTVAAGDIHRWHDNGITHFSDRASAAAVPTQAQTLPIRRVTEDELRGEWLAVTYAGDAVQLELGAKGGFVFDRQARSSPARLYMCGDWRAAGAVLDLAVTARKEQLATGEISEQTEPSRAAWEILRAQRDLLILRMEGRSYAFRRQ